MANIYNTVPPGDGLTEYYGYAKWIDGVVLVRFFNDMALYGDPGNQDRLNVLGTRGRWTFNLTFNEKGQISQKPNIGITMVEGTGYSDKILSETVDRPDREQGETFADLTTRWVRSAYAKLLEFNATVDNPFVFHTDNSPWYVNPAMLQIDGSHPTSDYSIGNALCEWTAPVIGQWRGSSGTTINMMVTAHGGRVTAPVTMAPGHMMVQYSISDFSDVDWMRDICEATGNALPRIGDPFVVCYIDGNVVMMGRSASWTYGENSPGTGLILNSGTCDIQRVSIYDNLPMAMARFLSMNPQ